MTAEAASGVGKGERVRGYFITGTDTGIGKTRVGVALLHALRRQGRPALGFKPVASGCDATAAGLRNADALALQAAGARPLPYSVVNPYAFAPPVAPHLAAARAGVAIDLRRITDVIASARPEWAVVEGVGGWLVPLNERETVADLAAALRLPVILVVGLRLGCLNHALLTVAAIRARRIALAGWVANLIDPAFADDAAANIASLQARLDLPLLARLPWDGAASPEDLAARFCLPDAD